MDHIRELRGVLLISLFVMVAPLIFYPKSLGIKLDMSVSLLSVFELAWYTMIFLLLFSRVSISWLMLCVISTLAYRLFLGVGFGLFLAAMPPEDFSFSWRRVIYGYWPSFLLQATMAPFILKRSLETLVRKPTRRKKAPESHEKMTSEGTSVSFQTPIPKPGRDQMNLTSYTEDRNRSKSADLENAVHYLREYSGVKGAILVDDEGLVVACDRSSDLDPEIFASLALGLKEANNLLLERINEQGLKRMGIHTPDLWISLNQILRFTLVTVADRNTDELLSVRISQATGMLRKYLEDRYNQNIL